MARFDLPRIAAQILMALNGTSHLSNSSLKEIISIKRAGGSLSGEYPVFPVTGSAVDEESTRQSGTVWTKPSAHFLLWAV